VTVLDAHNAGADGCEHHGARLLATLEGGRVYRLPDAPEGAAIRVFKAAGTTRPFPWLTNAPRTAPNLFSLAEDTRSERMLTMTETTQPPHIDQTQDSLPIEPCEPEFIDGSYQGGCGICSYCLEQEDQAIEDRVASGDLTDEEAQEIHRDNYARRTLDGLHDDDDHGDFSEPRLDGIPD
jgi:hypothetical protein